MAISKQTLSSGYALRLGLFTAKNLWHCAITIMYLAYVFCISFNIVIMVQPVYKIVFQKWTVLIAISVDKIDVFERNNSFSGMACAANDQHTSNDVPMVALRKKL